METTILIACLAIILILGITSGTTYISINNRLYVHLKTGREYFVLGKCSIKNAETGIWEDGISYTPRYDDNTYVRRSDDFKNKFISKKEWKRILKNRMSETTI